MSEAFDRVGGLEVIPEPMTFSLFMLSMTMLWWLRRRITC